MGLYINPGNEAFKISIHDDIYIDQSGILNFTNNRIGKRKRYLCVSRPRRFGKSLTAEMLTAYYDRNCDSRSLFQGLEIAEDESYERNLNQYDVFSVNIQQFLRGAGEPAQLVPYMEEQLLQELRDMYGSLYDFPSVNLPTALSVLFAKEEREKKGFIFIIDEWDCIFREAPEDKQAQKAYLDFLRDLLKDRTYVKLAYMTGILPVKKYGTHSTLNIFDEFSMTEPKSLAKYIGFSEKNVMDLCEKYQMDFDEAKRWYDGYGFKQISHVYNPKSVVDAMLEKSFQNYWISTETYEALRIYIDMNFDGLKDAVIAMLGGLSCEIDTGTYQNDMTSFGGRDDVLTLLVHLGYLAYNEESHMVSIPNDEVRSEFLRAVKSSGWNEVKGNIYADKIKKDSFPAEDGHIESILIGVDQAKVSFQTWDSRKLVLIFNNIGSTMSSHSVYGDISRFEVISIDNGYKRFVFYSAWYDENNEDKQALSIEAESLEIFQVGAGAEINSALFDVGYEYIGDQECPYYGG